ncbi:MAG: hypothetical protein IIW21_05475 [Clostridia bacterium]|nr:hypothetical protein [Clostridia bacterium]
MKKRAVSLLLAVLMLSSAFMFAACSGDSGNTDIPAATTDGSTPAQTTVPAETTAPFHIEDEDMDGYEFLQYEVSFSAGTNTLDFLYETEGGSVLDEAKYKRNSLVEEKFNIVLTTESAKASSTTGSNEGYGKFLQAKNAGDAGYDICVLPAYDQTKLAQNGALFDILAVPHLDTTAEYWDQTAVKELTIKDTLFFLTGDFSINAHSATICIAFNKEIAKERSINDLYTLVENGSWTFDKFAEYTRMVSEDLNGDDKFTNMDLYGALCWDDAIYAVVHNANQRCAYVDDNGDLVLGLGTEGVYTSFNSFVSLFNEDCALRYQVKFNENGTYTNSSGSTYGLEMFANNQGLFFISSLGSISNNFRDMDVDYGILPMFKAHSGIDEYYTTVAPYSARFLAMPLFQNDEEIAGKVIETIGYYSASTIVPAYYDKTLNGTVVRDEESSPMLDIVFAHRVFDLGYFYQPGNINKELIYQFRAENADWMSTYAKKEKTATVYLKSINTALSTQAEYWANEK